jgi:hypothetical protein
MEFSKPETSQKSHRLVRLELFLLPRHFAPRSLTSITSVLHVIKNHISPMAYSISFLLEEAPPPFQFLRTPVFSFFSIQQELRFSNFSSKIIKNYTEAGSGS